MSSGSVSADVTIQPSAVLREIDQFGLHYIEQPLHWDDLTDHAVLAKELRTPLCLDESLTSPARVRAALDAGACTVVNVKVGRVGGLQSVREIHDLCVARNVPMWCGGMLETGIGRAHNIALATLPNFTLPGDVSASQRYWKQDVIQPEVTVTPRGTIEVPAGPGNGFAVESARIAALTVREVALP